MTCDMLISTTCNNDLIKFFYDNYFYLRIKKQIVERSTATVATQSDMIQGFYQVNEVNIVKFDWSIQVYNGYNMHYYTLFF